MVLAIASSSFPSTTTGWYPTASPCTPALHGVYRPRSRQILSCRNPQSLEPYARTLDRPLPFNPGPQVVAQLGRNPLRRFDHRMVTRPFGRANPLAVLPSSAEGCFSGLRHLVHHTQPRSDYAGSLNTGYHQTGRSPLVANLELLPCHFPYDSSSVQLGAWSYGTALNSTACSCSSHIFRALRHVYMLAAPD